MNYINTFIEIAQDCPARTASAPEMKTGKRTMPALQFEMLANHPYKYTQEDVLFETYAEYNEIPKPKWPAERTKFFSKGQPCLRCSSLGKRYGWGIHADAKGRLALYAIESGDYKRLAGDPSLKHVKAMRSKRG